VANVLQKQGHSVWVLTPDKGEPVHGFPIPVETFRWAGDEKVLTRLSPRRLPDLYRLGRIMAGGRWALTRLVRRTQAEAILAMWAVPSGYWAAGSDLPFAVWALGSDIWGIGRYPLGRQIVRGILRSAGHIFADGFNLVDDIHALAQRQAEFLASARMLPVDSTPAAPLSKPGPHYLFIGRWDLAKGSDLLLEAMALLRHKVPSAHLHLFGGGAMAEALRRRASQIDLRDRVTVYGYADPPTATAYLKACDVLVIPSRIESIPIIFSDALACQCPVVATAVGDMAQLIREHQVGVLCPPEDPQALAGAMASIVEFGQPRDRYRAALERTAPLFSIARSAERCAEVLGALAQSRFHEMT
jgi:glycosyltransferase involved in cell wall biosynthesis